MNVGIIGGGILGGNHAKWLRENTKHEPKVYDTDAAKANATLEEVAMCPIVYVCVPTNGKRNGDLDHDIAGNSLRLIFNARMGKTDEHLIVVFRSTVPVGFTRRMEHYRDVFDAFRDNVSIFYVPEFLTENTAENDFASPAFVLVGASDGKMPDEERQQTTFKSCLQEIIASMPVAGRIELAKYEEAELLKLSTNAFYAMKVTFANEIHDYCEKTGIQYRAIKNLMSCNPRIGSHPDDNQGQDVHLRISQDGKPGYGGKCLPKDTNQLVRHMRKAGAGFGLIEKVSKINDKIRK